MNREWFAVVVIHKPSFKTAYTKHIFNNEVEAIQKCEEFQAVTTSAKIAIDYGVEPISNEDKKRVESGEVVYL